MMVCAGSTVSRDDILRLQASVKTANSLPESGQAFDIPISQPFFAELFPELLPVKAGQFPSSSREIESTQVSAMVYLAPVS